MIREDINDLLQSLRSCSFEPTVIDGHYLAEGEADRYAAQLEMDLDFYLDENFETAKSILESIKDFFDDADDASWMFDDEENEERNAEW